MLWWLLWKVVGVFFILAGVFLVIFFPGTKDHQNAARGDAEVPFDIVGVIIGFILLVVGGFMVFGELLG